MIFSYVKKWCIDNRIGFLIAGTGLSINKCLDLESKAMTSLTFEADMDSVYFKWTEHECFIKTDGTYLWVVIKKRGHAQYIYALFVLLLLQPKIKVLKGIATEALTFPCSLFILLMEVFWEKGLSWSTNATT